MISYSCNCIHNFIRVEHIHKSHTFFVQNLILTTCMFDQNTLWLWIFDVISCDALWYGVNGDFSPFHYRFNSFWTVFTMKCTARARPITLKKLLIWLTLSFVIRLKNLVYHFEYIQFWIASHFVLGSSSLSLLTLMLTLISKFFVVCLNNKLQIFIWQTPLKLQSLLKQKPCFLMPWV